MDRRKSIKALIAGTVSAGTLLEACKLQDKKEEKKADEGAAAPADGINRMKEEAAHDASVRSATYFTADEMATLRILCDIIIPRDEVSGSASDAKVPEFIGVIVNDMPQHQTPMRGGLRWLDMQCLTRYGKPFSGCDQRQQMEIVDEIAWPKKAKPGMEQGVAFFNLARNLTASGFYTSQIGMKDVGYIGNVPNQWNGVPEDVLKQYKLAYSEKELKECISFSA
ncbi:MAG: gluconate 2-dehydrogenase subunit 3 family protein [Bacteroidota bacterium]|nr:gluconate 2-dehydrogenase subunit 3 family protein [Bacteroidota bacterium]MDP4218118.1 gluconate 2-dehydrogenase subunit 3 family protein [Bacteroidota bacterium]MDP4246515.1 gluconate 2-dehydrogenase subunit 3 family protein [Bacteroidota bacterium]MDP4254307.1 gluconate 2-dehydrogenase subunit 3 family protein [Bacteroidota bacterium]MDP4259283.1 gluconate 2-dehydrogenase subunit 3 family protein [Bacteroidota bacterium]